MISRRKVRLRCGPRTRQCGGRCLPLGLFCRGDINGTVRSLEDSIKDKSIEHLYLIDARTGELKAKTIGDKYSVSIPNEKWIKGNIVTHNHPPLVNDRSSAMYKGQSLSVHDVILAARYDAKEIRAVTTAYRHSMSPKGKWAEEKALADSYNKHYDRTVNKMRWDMVFGNLSADEANASLWHEINKKVAKEMNMNYTRTTLGGFRVDAVRCNTGNKRCGNRCVPSKFQCKSSKPSRGKPSLTTTQKITIGGVAIGSIAVATIGTVLIDVKKNLLSGNPTRKTPSGKVDKISMDTYDGFLPGDLVRSTTDFGSGGFYHYAVYTGKKNNRHYFIERMDNKAASELNEFSLGIGDPQKTDFEKVDVENKSSVDEIVSRINSLRGKELQYDILNDNCEHLARYIVTGKWESLQQNAASPLTRSVVKMIFDFSRMISGQSGLPANDFTRKADSADSALSLHQSIMEKLKGVPGKIGELCYAKILGKHFFELALKSQEKLDAEELQKSESKEMPPTDEASLADLSDKISRLAYAIISRSYQKRIDRFLSIDPVSESVLSGTFVSEGKIVGFTIDIDKQNVETWHPQFQKQDNKMCTVGLSCGNSCVNKSKKCNLGLSQIASPEEITQLKSLTTNAFNVFKIELQRQYMEFHSATGLRGILPHLKFAIDRIGIEQKLKAGEAVLSEQAQTPFLASRKGNNAKRDLIMDAYFASHHPDKVGNLEVEDVAAIRSYARPLYYKWTNSILRGNKENLAAVSEHPYVKGFYSGEKEIIEAGKAHISALEKALNKLDSHDGIVYRGLELPEDLIQTTLKKGQWIENGFMSTTKDKGKMYPGNTIMEIRSRNGKDISKIEPLPNDEVLFNRGTALKLVSHRTSRNKGKTMYHLVFDELMRTDSEPVRVDTDAATLGRAKAHLQQLTYRILSRSYRERIDRFVSMDTPTLEMVSGSFISRGRLVGFSLDLSKNKVSTWIVKDRRIDRLDAFRKIQKNKCETGLPCGTVCISKKNKCTVALGTIANASEIRQAKQLTTFLRQETSPPPQPPSSIRDLRKIASAKGVVRYSRMNKSELEAAIKAVDSPAASRQRLQDTLKKKEVAELFATKNALSDYAKDWNTFQKIMAVSGTVGAPALLTAFVYLQGRPAQEAEKIAKDYEAAYGSMADSAEQEAAKLVVKPTEKPAILFVVGGYKNEGSNAEAMKQELEKQAKENSNNPNYEYLAKENEIYTFEQSYQPGNLPPGDDRFNDNAKNSYNLPHKMFLYHNAIKGYFYQRGDVMRQIYEGVTGKGAESPRNEDAQRLAAQLYATARAKEDLPLISAMDKKDLFAEYKKTTGNDFPMHDPDLKEFRKVITGLRALRSELDNQKPINILAHGAGGGTAREAIEILSRMGKEGETIAKRVNLVSLSSPSFNLTDLSKKVALERNLIARNDPFAPVAGKKRYTIPQVKNREYSTFIGNKYTIEEIAKYFSRLQVEKSKHEAQQGINTIHNKWAAAAAKAAAKAATGGGSTP